MPRKPKQYDDYGDFIVTENKKEGTRTIYTKDGEFLSTVNDHELMAEME